MTGDVAQRSALATGRRDSFSELARTGGRNPFSCHCITCSDEGLAMDVVAIDEDRGIALCADDDGARQTVEVALVAALVPGDRVLVHAGVALLRLEAAA